MTTAHQLQGFYSEFDVTNRILLSGHSHQAWPNAAKQGLLDCFNDAAKHIDDKWGAAFEKADKVRDFYRTLLGESHGEIALGQSTHELILRFLSDLSCFKHKKQTPIKIVTTNGEFHSMRRQLDRLKDVNIDVKVIDTQPQDTLAERLINALDKDTDAVLVSAVFFASSRIFHQVGDVAVAANTLNIPCLVDVYHALNVIPFSLASWQLETAFIVGGGYKYCQAGEGNCFMRIPKGYNGSPIITGWFAEFESLDQAPGKVGYGKGQGAFAGSTYDPTSHYRAAAVFDFFNAQGLSAERLADINKQQITRLWQGIESMALTAGVLTLPEHGIDNNAGFLSLTTPEAATWVKKLAEQGIQTDSRGNQLRLGPAPYVTDEQLDNALDVIANIAKTMV
ncbi:MAG: kynureninase [Pseudoalteromonas spongiae]